MNAPQTKDVPPELHARIAKMLEKVKATQWALAEIDWDAPGRELVTEDKAFYPKLKAFMADLMWIEHVGARLCGDGQKSPQRHAARDVPVFSRRRTTPRQR
nr:hypothetical protein [Sinimarinibacterium sp. NLF-5-8]